MCDDRKVVEMKWNEAVQHDVMRNVSLYNRKEQ